MRAGRFFGQLKLDWLDKNFWRLDQARCPPFAYLTSAGQYIEPPDLMITDLGSVPRFFWRILPRNEFGPAYVIHDWLYYNQAIGYYPITRKQADYILGEAIFTMGGSAFKRFLIYRALRHCIFAWVYWNGYKKRKAL